MTNAKAQYLELSQSEIAEVSQEDILRLYSHVSDQNRNNMRYLHIRFGWFILPSYCFRVFFDIEADGEFIGKIVIQLRFDVVPR